MVQQVISQRDCSFWRTYNSAEENCDKQGAKEKLLHPDLKHPVLLTALLKGPNV